MSTPTTTEPSSTPTSTPSSSPPSFARLRDFAVNAMRLAVYSGSPNGIVERERLFDEARVLFDLILEQRMPQRQDSLTDQLRSVHALAVYHGCYDAADYLRRVIEKPTKSDKGGS